MEHPDLISTLIPDQRWTTREVAARLRVHLVTVGRWTRIGVRGVKLRTVRIGGRTLVGTDDLIAFLQQINEPGFGRNAIAGTGSACDSPPEPGGAGGGDG